MNESSDKCKHSEKDSQILKRQKVCEYLKEIKELRQSVESEIKKLTYEKVVYTLNPLNINSQFIERFNEFYSQKLPSEIKIDKNIANSLKTDDSMYKFMNTLKTKFNSEENPSRVEEDFFNRKDIQFYNSFIENVENYMENSFRENISEPAYCNTISLNTQLSKLKRMKNNFSPEELRKLHSLIGEMKFDVNYDTLAKKMKKTKEECIVMSYWIPPHKKRGRKIKNNDSFLLTSEGPDSEMINRSSRGTEINETLESEKIEPQKTETNDIQTTPTKSDEEIIQNSYENPTIQILNEWTIDERRIFALYFPFLRRNFSQMNEYISTKSIPEIENYYNIYFRKLKKKEKLFEQQLVSIPDYEKFKRFRRLSLIDNCCIEELRKEEEKDIKFYENSGLIFNLKKK